MLINRFVFCGYPDGEVSLRHVDNINNVSLFFGEGMVFLYLETPLSDCCPDDVVQGNMKPYPDGTHWRRMMDIFHYSVPQSMEHWTRLNPDRKPHMRLVYLKPDMVSYYIFYHFQLQEERSKPMEYKFCSIYLLGNLLAMYGESPDEKEDDLYPGLLSTHNTPSDWQAVVGPAFQCWSDGIQDDWRYIRLLDTMDQI